MSIAATTLIFHRKGDPRFVSAPAVGGFAITPSNSTVFTKATRQIRVGTGGGGTLKVRFLDGTDLTISNVADGETFDYQVDKVYLTGTSVSNITGVY